jgi:hypothetical protein
MEKESEVEYDDYSELEGELLTYQMDLEFLGKLPKEEIRPGITKFILKQPKSLPLVEPDSHISCMKHHRTKEGCWEKLNNISYQQGRKVKLAGQGDAELVECLKTMKPNEISYFLIEREILDKTLPDLNSEVLTPQEKKRFTSDRLLDGYNRLEVVEETKIKRNETGVSESVEDRLAHIATCKVNGNTHFKNFEYDKACKEYLKGFNLSSQFPKKKAQDEGKNQLVADLTKLRRDLINNCLKAVFKCKNMKPCLPLFEEKVLEEMKDNFTYVDCLATIWVESTLSESIALDVSSLIEYLEKYVNSGLPSEEEARAITAHIAKLKKYEKSVNILNNLRSYTDRAEEFEREQKIAEKIRQRKEAEASLQPVVFKANPTEESTQN